MAKPSINNISANNTFQVWLDRTNEVIDIIKTDTLTASVLGDTTGTVGAPLSSSLIGTFTANNVIASDLLRANTLSPKVGSTAISITNPVSITATGQTTTTFISITGPQAVFTTGSVNWNVGFSNITDNNFIINSGSGANKFALSTAGNLVIPGIMTANEFIGSLTGSITGNAETVTNGVLTIGNQTIAGTKTFSSTIVGSITGNAGTVTNGVLTLGNQTIAGTKTFSSTIVGSITGNAGTVTNGVYTNRQVIAGTGLTGGGTLAADRTFNIDIATQSQAEVAADNTKVMTPLRTKQSAVRNGLPSGSVIYVAQAAAPAGYLKANGAAISRTTFADLFSVIGTLFGTGDGSTTFNLPDLRGEFIRGLSDGRVGVDFGRSLGSLQLDATQRIIGTFPAINRGDPAPTGPFTRLADYGGGPFGQGNAGSRRLFQFDNDLVARTSTETRPRNIALLACIKF